MEYEYSFEVNDWQPYIDFCVQQGYNLIEDSYQKRIIYRNSNKTIARLTISKQQGKTIKKLDFKEDKLSNDVLITRKESQALVYEDDKACESILEFLNYKKDNTLERTRKTYEKDDVKFEIDHYFLPKETFVIAIEGDNKKVDEVYNLIKNLPLQ